MNSVDLADKGSSPHSAQAFPKPTQAFGACSGTAQVLPSRRFPDGRPAQDGLGDVHYAATATANEGRQCSHGGFINDRRRLGRIEQVAHPDQLPAALGMGLQALMADTVEATGEYVQEKVSDEFVVRKCHRLLTRSAFGAVILPAKRHTLLVHPH